MVFTARERAILGAAIVVEGGLAAVAVALAWLFDRPLAAQFAWSTSGLMWGLAAALPPSLALALILRWPGPLRHFVDAVRALLHSELGRPRWATVALIATLAGVGEELLFRGVLQPWLIQWWGVATGLAVTSLLFGLAHPVSWPYFTFAAGMGLYLGGLHLVTGDLAGPIVAHALYDFIALLLLLAPRAHCGPPNGPSTDSSVAHG